MTKQNVRETTQNVIIPASVALGVIALAAKAIGLVPSLNASQIDTGIRDRLTAVESRQVEMERRWREDRNDTQRILFEIQGAVKRIEGKLEK